jgi:hypothetical protein
MKRRWGPCRLSTRFYETFRRFVGDDERLAWGYVSCVLLWYKQRPASRSEVIPPHPTYNLPRNLVHTDTKDAVSLTYASISLKTTIHQRFNKVSHDTSAGVETRRAEPPSGRTANPKLHPKLSGEPGLPGLRRGLLVS